MSALTRWLTVLGVAAGLTLLAALAPIAFRKWDAFRVRRIEVTGTHFMAPEAALAASGITDTSSVFDDATRWAQRLRAQRMVADARVVRRLPGTVRIEVVEREPVALVRTPELRAVDARGRVLPMNVAGEDVDLPVITERTKLSGDSAVDAATARVVRTLLEIRAFDPQLAHSISEIGRVAGGLRLLLREPQSAEVLLPARPDERKLHEVRLAMEQLRSEGGANGTGGTALDHLARMDARFADELFVSLSGAGRTQR